MYLHFQPSPRYFKEQREEPYSCGCPPVGPDGEQGALQWRCAVPKLLNGAAISRPEPGPFPWLQMSLLVAPETGSARMGDARRSGAHTA